MLPFLVDVWMFLKSTNTASPTFLWHCSEIVLIESHLGTLVVPSGLFVNERTKEELKLREHCDSGSVDGLRICITFCLAILAIHGREGFDVVREGVKVHLREKNWSEAPESKAGIGGIERTVSRYSRVPGEGPASS
jgi:hypothetical protein